MVEDGGDGQINADADVSRCPRPAPGNYSAGNLKNYTTRATAFPRMPAKATRALRRARILPITGRLANRRGVPRESERRPPPEYSRPGAQSSDLAA